MSTPKYNSAIWYASDGDDPDNKGINGRRVAGASFLKGFAAHGRVEEFVKRKLDNTTSAPVTKTCEYAAIFALPAQMLSAYIYR